MKSKYTYFVTFKTESLGLKQLEHSITIDTDFKVKCKDSVSELIYRIKVELSLEDMLMHNFILISETHEPEKSDDKKDALIELHEWFTKYDAQIETFNNKGLSIYIGSNKLIATDNFIIDADDVEKTLLEL